MPSVITRIKHPLSVVLLIVAGAIFIFQWDNSIDSQQLQLQQEQQQRRKLRRNRSPPTAVALLTDPKTVTLRSDAPLEQQDQQSQQPNNPITATIILNYHPKPYGSHIFNTDVFTRYTTGRLNFEIKEHSWFTSKQEEHDPDDGPCLAVGGRDQESYDKLKADYPHCKTMNVDDEHCQASNDYDFRNYYAANIPSRYIPLGMRYDSYTAFKKIQEENGGMNFVIKPPSQRTHAFNAIFSLNTDTSRQQLADIIEREQTKDEGEDKALDIVATFTARWSARANPKKSSMSMGPGEYIEVLLDSIFTLSPFGHNPECFRMFEAIEAGSIPVIIRDRYMESRGPRGQSHKCHKAMELWYDSPVLMLNNWEELYPAMRALMSEPERLDEMYRKVRAWYDEEFMGKYIRELEDVLLEGYL